MNFIQSFFAEPEIIVKTTQVDVGSEIHVKSIDGELFSCHTVISATNNDKNLIRKNLLLAITSSQIVELIPHPLKRDMVTVKEVHELEGLSKLRFKKGSAGVLILEFKSGKQSKLVMKDPASCVEYMKLKMKEVGINGNVTKTTKVERNLANAKAFFERTKEIETQFSLTPTFESIEEMMDLLRRSAEKFGEANDDSYTEVIDYIKRFLQRTDVLAILDKTPKGSGSTDSTGNGNDRSSVKIVDNSAQSEALQQPSNGTKSEPTLLDHVLSQQPPVSVADTESAPQNILAAAESAASQTTQVSPKDIVASMVSPTKHHNNHSTCNLSTNNSSNNNNHIQTPITPLTKEQERKTLSKIKEAAMSFRFDDHAHEHESDDDYNQLMNHHREKSELTPRVADKSLVEVDVEVEDEEDKTKELSVLLDNITDEFDELLSSFETITATTATDVSENHTATVAGDVEGVVSSGRVTRSESNTSAATAGSGSVAGGIPTAFDLTEFERMMEL